MISQVFNESSIDAQSTPQASSTPSIQRNSTISSSSSSSKTRRNLISPDNSSLSNENFDKLSESILSHLKFNVKQQSETTRQRVDSYTSGKVLNEETVKAIIQDKNEKKKVALATKTLKAQNNATKAYKKS